MPSTWYAREGDSVVWPTELRINLCVVRGAWWGDVVRGAWWGDVVRVAWWGDVVWWGSVVG